MQAPLSPKEGAQIKQQCLELKWNFSEAKVRYRQNKLGSKCLGSGLHLGCAPELCCQTTAVSGAAHSTGLCLSLCNRSLNTALRIKPMDFTVMQKLFFFLNSTITKIVQNPTVTLLGLTSPSIHMISQKI